MKRILHTFSAIALLGGSLLLASCGATTQQASTLLPANTYLQMAASNTGNEQRHYQLLAAERFLLDHNIKASESLLNQLNLAKDLTEPQYNQLQLLRADYFLQTYRPYPALKVLQHIGASTNLNQQRSVRRLQLLAKAYDLAGNPLAALTVRGQWLQAAPDDSNNIVHNTWQQLNTLTVSQLQKIQSKATDPTAQGWIALALLSKQSTMNSEQWANAIAAWKNQYPDHPANTLLATNDDYTPITQSAPQNIALLLPLTGNYAKAGQAIRNGFFSAYYQNKKLQHSNENIHVYDTNAQDITTVYQKALSDGTDFVVGPLLKNNVATLADSGDISVPTLALNTLNNSDSVEKLYQFGLSPLDEVHQIVASAWQANHRQIAILAPNSNWGQNIAKELNNAWQTLGGTIVSQQNFGDQHSYSRSVQKLLNINQSEARAWQMKNLFQQKIRYLLRRRQDIDAIFLVANPAQGRQILPLLKYFYASNIPVYAISSVYQGTPNPRKDHDLNGVMFCSMPWVFDAKQHLSQPLWTLHQQVSKLWPRLFSNEPKLFALGIDAFTLTQRLNQLSQYNQIGLNGASGQLFLNANNVVTRRLLWAQIRYGVPHALH